MFSQIFFLSPRPGSDYVWSLPVVCCWREFEVVCLLHIFWIGVASSFELWQPHPCVIPLWTHDVLDSDPCLSEVPLSSSHSGLSNL